MPRVPLELLDQDTACAKDPGGDRPLLTADYQRALHAILALLLDNPLVAPGSVVRDAEVSAFTVGQAAFADAVLATLIEACTPDKLN